MARNSRLHFKSNLAFDRARQKWHIRVMLNGKTVQKGGFSSKSTARQYLDFLLLQSLNVPVEHPAPTVAEAWADYEKHLRLLGRSSNTLDYYTVKVQPLKDAFGNKQLNQIDQALIEEFVTARKQHVSGGTVNAELATLRTLFKSAKIAPQWELERLTHTVQPRHVHPPEVVRKFWNELSQPARAACGLCLLSGLRGEDTRRAQASWVDGHVLTLPVTKTGSFSTWLVDSLLDVLPKSGPLCTLTGSKLRWELLKTSKRLGIKPAYQGPGVFRHHAATYLTDFGGHLESDVRAILGHGKPITARYLRGTQLPLKRRLLEDLERIIFPEK